MQASHHLYGPLRADEPFIVPDGAFNVPVDVVSL